MPCFAVAAVYGGEQNGIKFNYYYFGDYLIAEIISISSHLLSRRWDDFL